MRDGSYEQKLSCVHFHSLLEALKFNAYWEGCIFYLAVKAISNTIP
jgi:hypothetical protein